jgi:hypothetical protein
MYFYAMKAELLEKLRLKGLLGNFKPEPEWVEAFNEYKKATGDKEVGHKCGSCYRKVLKWLRG